MPGKKIAFIGEDAAFAPFSALGLEVYHAESADEARAVIESLELAQYALLVMTPAAAVARSDRENPPVLVLPGFHDRETGQEKIIARAIARATGRTED